MLSQAQKRFFTNKNLQRAVIVSAVRTPIGSFQGKLSSITAPKLGSVAVRAAVERAGISVNDVQEVLLGNVCSAGVGQAPARQASVNAGIPFSVPCTTVNKVCASGMKTVMFGAQSIMLGQHNCIVAGGFESMSNIPYYLPKARNGLRYGHGTIEDGLLLDGLTDAFSGKAMGICGDETARRYGFTREDQDQYAIKAYQRAQHAQQTGLFSNEIVTVSVPSAKKGGEPTNVSEDEEPKNLKLDKMGSLKPAFSPEGTVTAANASKLNDGASALVIMSEEKAQRIGVKPLARIVGFADAEQQPIDFPTTPSLAIPKALAAAGMNKSAVDYYEINEAFSIVALANAKILDLDIERLNVNGGGVSLGHPIGSSGARIIVTLLNVLKQRDAGVGVASICNGGGGASAIVIERIQ